MFSARTRWDLRPNRLATLLQEKRASGDTVLDLTETNPTRVGLSYPADVLSLLADPAGLRYEPAAMGATQARRAVADDYRRRGFQVEPERVILTTSSSEAYALLFKLLCDPGDIVLVPQPSYPLFDHLARLEGVETRPYPLHHDGEWHLHESAVAEAANTGARAVVVVNPNNPTGSFLKRQEAAPLAALCAGEGMALISDEVFADYAFAGDSRRLGSLVEEKSALCFCLGGLSKSCGLPQLKLGWIAVAGPDGGVQEALARLEMEADTYLSVSTPVQLAAPGILERLPELCDPILRRVTANLATLRASVQSVQTVTLLAPEGGWSAVLRIPATVPEEERVLGLLSEENVLVHPGYFFDFPTEAVLVLSLLAPPDTFAEGVDRILTRLRSEEL
jgi:aspartate/methionine/tyrosine aminotransferase